MASNAGFSDVIVERDSLMMIQVIIDHNIPIFIARLIKNILHFSNPF